MNRRVSTTTLIWTQRGYVFHHFDWREILRNRSA